MKLYNVMLSYSIASQELTSDKYEYRRILDKEGSTCKDQSVFKAQKAGRLVCW